MPLPIQMEMIEVNDVIRQVKAMLGMIFFSTSVRAGAIKLIIWH